MPNNITSNSYFCKGPNKLCGKIMTYSSLPLLSLGARCYISEPQSCRNIWGV